MSLTAVVLNDMRSNMVGHVDQNLIAPFAFTNVRLPVHGFLFKNAASNAVVPRRLQVAVKAPMASRNSARLRYARNNRLRRTLRLCCHWHGVQRLLSALRRSQTGANPHSPRVLMKVENAVKVEPVGEFELKGIRRPLIASRHRSTVSEMTRSDCSAPSDNPFSKSSSMRPI